MKYIVEYLGDGGVTIDGVEQYCPLDGDLEYGCKDCAYVAEYRYNTLTGNCEEI